MYVRKHVACMVMVIVYRLRRIHHRHLLIYPHLLDLPHMAGAATSTSPPCSAPRRPRREARSRWPSSHPARMSAGWSRGDEWGAGGSARGQRPAAESRSRQDAAADGEARRVAARDLGEPRVRRREPDEELLAPPRATGRHYPKAEREVKERGNGRVRKLLPDPVPGMEIDRLELPPDARMTGVPHTPGTREYLACEKGQSTLVASGERFDLKPGDVVAFRGDQRHSYANLGRTRAIGYSIVMLVSPLSVR